MSSGWSDEKVRSYVDNFRANYVASTLAEEVLNLRAQVRSLQASMSQAGQDRGETTEASTSDSEGPIEAVVRAADDGSLDLVSIQGANTTFCLERIGTMGWHLSVSDGISSVGELVSMTFRASAIVSQCDVDFAWVASDLDVSHDAWDNWLSCDGEE